MPRFTDDILLLPIPRDKFGGAKHQPYAESWQTGYKIVVIGCKRGLDRCAQRTVQVTTELNSPFTKYVAAALEEYRQVLRVPNIIDGEDEKMKKCIKV